MTYLRFQSKIKKISFDNLFAHDLHIVLDVLVGMQSAHLGPYFAFVIKLFICKILVCWGCLIALLLFLHCIPIKVFWSLMITSMPFKSQANPHNQTLCCLV
jgi:hypothetical protein